jgi:hypothetical protein
MFSLRNVTSFIYKLLNGRVFIAERSDLVTVVIVDTEKMFLT